MKQLLAFILAAFILTSCQTKETSTSSDSEGDILQIGKIDSLRSEILEETRNIWVYVPDEAAGAIYGQTNYPVLYLLDGPGHFHAVTIKPWKSSFIFFIFLLQLKQCILSPREFSEMYQ